jgi:hypothetical protein
MVRLSVFRRGVLSLEKAFSIGLKSGEEGERNRSVGPAALMASRTAALLWAGRLSRMTMSPGRRVGARNCLELPHQTGHGTG